jgi:hypothetical protein
VAVKSGEGGGASGRESRAKKKVGTGRGARGARLMLIFRDSAPRFTILRQRDRRVRRPGRGSGGGSGHLFVQRPTAPGPTGGRYAHPRRRSVHWVIMLRRPLSRSARPLENARDPV